MKKEPTLNDTVREAIGQALIRMLETLPFEKITVSELARVAGVSRSSFYRNYDSTRDVLADYIGTIYRGFFRGTTIPRAETETEGRAAFLLPRFRFIRDHAREFTALRKNGLLLYVFESMDRKLILRKGGLEDSASFYYEALTAGACAGLVGRWIDRGFRESPEEMAALLAGIPLRKRGNGEDV